MVNKIGLEGEDEVEELEEEEEERI